MDFRKADRLVAHKPKATPTYSRHKFPLSLPEHTDTLLGKVTGDISYRRSHRAECGGLVDATDTMVKQIYKCSGKPWGHFEYDLAEAVGDPGADGKRASGIKDDCRWRTGDQTPA
jgi:hypothetical protein